MPALECVCNVYFVSRTSAQCTKDVSNAKDVQNAPNAREVQNASIAKDDQNAPNAQNVQNAEKTLKKCISLKTLQILQTHKALKTRICIHRCSSGNFTKVAIRLNFNGIGPGLKSNHNHVTINIHNQNNQFSPGENIMNTS